MNEMMKRYKNTFVKLHDAESQCEYLMTMGFHVQCIDDIRIDTYRIEGCQTAIWMKTELVGNKVYFSCDSDSVLVKGVLAIFLELYQGKTLAEINSCSFDFINSISDEVIYPEIKQNGLLKCYHKLLDFNKKNTKGEYL